EVSGPDSHPYWPYVLDFIGGNFLMKWDPSWPWRWPE
ncbi:hypothetical protein AVEN_15280-1, partial [Araneus ventricosus]